MLMKKVIFKNCAPFTNCISEANNTQVDDADNTDVIVHMYNSIAYSDIYWKIFLQYCRSDLAFNNGGDLVDFPADDNDNSTSFKLKEKITGKTGNDGTKDVGIVVPLKYLSNVWRTIEILSTNHEISLHLKWCANCS